MKIRMKTLLQSMTQLIEDAKQGEVNAKKICWDRYKLKIWTYDELEALNLFLLKEKEMPKDDDSYQVQMVKEEAYLDLPQNFPEDTTRQAKLNWILPIGKHYFKAGLTYHDGGGTVWILALTDEGFIPLFNTMLVTIQELIDKSERLEKEFFTKRFKEVKDVSTPK